MRTVLSAIVGAIAALVLLAAAGLVYVRTSGLESRSAPGTLETAVARAARRFAVPRTAKDRTNPAVPSADSLGEGMSHFADHCASCHANDGSGDTAMGRGLYPKAPDMRLPATQDLSDGELFWIIENGIRFTGMPAWSTGATAGEESSWHLVQFIRHLPKLTAAEVESMRQLNPRSPEEIRQEIEEERFLNPGAP